MSRPLTVGFLHLGRAGSGVGRYGRIVAAGAAARDDVRVVEVAADARGGGWRELDAAARALREADVVQLQWKLADWGGLRRALPRLELVLRRCGRPVVATLHDVYAPETRLDRHGPGAIALRRLAGRASALVVHAEEERRRLASLVASDRVRVVPHFVEAIPALEAREAARAGLGLAGRRIVTLQGYIVRRKGHRLAIESLRHLPDDVVLVIAGTTIEGREARARELEAYAAELGLAERVRFTGWVTDERLRTILAATDVALAPFLEMSASGSLATWVAAGRPIVTSALPQLRELAALEPGALRIVDADPHDPPAFAAALAARISALLADPPADPDPAVARLAARLAVPAVVDRYVDAWRTAAG